MAGFTLPERLVASDLDRAPQGQDGVGSGDAPVHARFFEAAPALIQALILAEKEGRLSKFFRQWWRFDLVIIDELVYVSLGPGGPLLFQFCSDRYERGSLLITSNLEFSRWSEVFSDPSLTTALLDRLTHHAHVLVFQGESYRFKESHNRKTGKPPKAL